MKRTPDTIRTALDTTLSGVSCDAALYGRVIRAAQGEAPSIKRKLTLSTAVVLLLILLAGSAAIAAACRGVSYFLVEHYDEENTLDSNYLFSVTQESHSNPLVTASVTDAYWDGVKLSVACLVAPVNAGQIIRSDCDEPTHHHYLPTEAADLQLNFSGTSDTVTITDTETGEIIQLMRLGSNCFCEEDGTLSVFYSIPLNSMSTSIAVSIPISITHLASGELVESVLRFRLPVVTDPIAEHEHQWEPATCISPKTCTICQRYEGELGDHQFQPSPNFPELSVCPVCKLVRNWSLGIPSDIVFQPGDDHEYVQVLQRHLKERGYLSFYFSNSYDDATMEAVKAFQQEHGLEPDGICDSETLLALFP